MFSSDLTKRNQAKTQYAEYLRRGAVVSGSGGVRSDSMHLRASTSHIHLTHEDRTRILDDHHTYLRGFHGHRPHHHDIVMPLPIALSLEPSAEPVVEPIAEPIVEPVVEPQVKRRIRTRPAPPSKLTLS